MRIELKVLLAATCLMAACQKKPAEVNAFNLVKAQAPDTKKNIGDEKTQFSIIANQRFSEEVLNGSINKLQSNPTASKTSLVLGYPMGLLHQQSVFGGVITGVSDKNDVNLGGLKLSDLPPLHVISEVDDKTNQLVFIGCEMNCSETSEQKVLLQIPILGVDPKAGLLYLDLSTLGSHLDIIQKMDPNGEDTGLLHKSSELVLFDFSLNTLVFDVASVMTQKQLIPGVQAADDVTITTRWYLKLASGFNPAFLPREQTAGVGFFTTSRSDKTYITRFSSTNFNSKAMTKYYLKNIPTRYRNAFAESFDSWNRKFQESVGREMFEYEFIEASDPRYALLVPGDIRYNILEWDLDNLAGYGGLGPSIANQFTGETMSANVLIQGPTIETIYTKWFEVSQKIKELKLQGNSHLADELELNLNRQMNQLSAKNSVSHTIRLGRNLDFRIASEDPRHHDPLLPQLNFDEAPEGFTYDTYMYGYFVDMVAHELGHNVGLRHNFRGNLGTNDSMTIGSVSRSIMEYLGRLFRHLDRLGDYDSMAITYGYTGKLPEHKNWFCTDENQVSPETPKNSAECSSSDATSDPFSFFEGRLDKSISLLTAKGTPEAPIWKLEDLQSPLSTAINGLAAYVVSAPFTADSWTNFIGKPDRPNDSLLIPNFILDRLSKKVCATDFAEIIGAKSSEEAKKITQDNITSFQKFFKKSVSAYTVPYAVFTQEKFPCLSGL